MALGINPSGMKTPFGAFTHAAWASAGRTLYISGQVGMDGDGGPRADRADPAQYRDRAARRGWNFRRHRIGDGVRDRDERSRENPRGASQVLQAAVPGQHAGRSEIARRSAADDRDQRGRSNPRLSGRAGHLMSADLVLYDLKDRVATITLNRPDRLKALSNALVSASRDALIHFERGDDRVAVLTGAGRAHLFGRRRPARSAARPPSCGNACPG